MLLRITLLIAAAVIFTFTTSLDAQPDPYADRIAKASNEWKKSLARMALPTGIQADLWAAEPLAANIVAFHFDEKGRCYVAETFRLKRGVTDNRDHMKKPGWMDDELACRTVADRIAMYKKHLKKDFASYEIETDRVRLIEDTTGSGRADKASVFADGFKNAEDGLGSGVLARNGKVWFTNIPALWLLQDTKGTGRADVKKALHTGYGVHTAFLGHDMHGLRFGPDGKLYFSIGDRGLHVETNGKVISSPDTGAVLRCNPDGSELELFATGLRNPQELAFDEFGNLFTGDNNADGGDQARWVHLVEGGDSGWRLGYQSMKSLGPWNEEKLWHTQPTNTAHYLLPPLAHIGSGPSGLTYHPGTSLLPAKYERTFFLCDFRGGSGGSGIHAFQLQTKGASFEVINRQKFVSTILVTDCDFGPDGGFYLSDWHEGWGMPNKGRIFKLFDPAKKDDATVKEVKKLLAEGFEQRSAKELAKLIEHKDQRIRQEAQFALVQNLEIETLAQAAFESTIMGRIHAIWGLGQIGRKHPKANDFLLLLTSASDPEIRAQAFRVLGDNQAFKAFPASKEPKALTALRNGLKAEQPRLRYYAAMAARACDKSMVPDVIEMLRGNNDADPYLRHAGVMALASINDRDAMQKAATDASSAVRMATLLAMRRLHMPEVASFLNDADPKIVLEAARAIYDEPIAAALPKLGELAQRPMKDVPPPALSRMLAANYRLGNASALISAATRADIPTPLREQALKMLQSWEKPSGRDWIVGLWRPIKERSAKEVANAVRPALAALMTGPTSVRTEAAKLAAQHGIKEVGPALREIVADKTQTTGTRIASLQALESLKDAKLDESAKAALGDTEPRLRHQGRRILLANAPSAKVIQELTPVLSDGATVERQGALQILAKVRAPEAEQLLETWVDHLLSKKAPAEIQLDILLAAADSKSTAIKDKLARYEMTRDLKDPMSVYRETMIGGDAENGRKVFLEKTELSCVRCHKLNGVGGDVGPDLTGIGKKYKRDYLLEAIVTPDKQIAKGYESTALTLTNGLTKIGIVKSEDAKEVRLMTAEGQLLAIPKSQIEDRARAPSAMPADLAPKMSRSEVRDLVEFLSGLQ